MTTDELKAAILEWAKEHSLTYVHVEVSIASPRNIARIYTVKQEKKEIID